jgi:hypothetical protein
MKFLNLTPHPITVFDGELSTVYPVHGPAPRLAVSREDLGSMPDTSGPGEYNYCGQMVVDGLLVRCPRMLFVRSTLGDPLGLPVAQEGVILIVSALVAEHPSVASRVDLASPGEAVRDDNGKIVGCKGLCAGPGLAAVLREAEVAASSRSAAYYFERK